MAEPLKTFVAKNGETGDIYLAKAPTEDDARIMLGDSVPSDGDEFQIVHMPDLPEADAVNITDLLK